MACRNNQRKSTALQTSKTEQEEGGRCIKNEKNLCLSVSERQRLREILRDREREGEREREVERETNLARDREIERERERDKYRERLYIYIWF